jgi:Holliday junction resolvase RusA-like endonuclease
MIATYPITPVPKPRMTRSDRWKKRPSVMRYRAFCDECRIRKVMLPESGAKVTFVLPMPRSWPPEKRAEMNGQPHQGTPDTSNMLKALEDALYADDSAIWHYAGLQKQWGESGQIIIETTEAS